jgi:hypothetical protein
MVDTWQHVAAPGEDLCAEEEPGVGRPRVRDGRSTFFMEGYHL